MWPVRMGGDEFICVCESATREQSREIMSMIQDMIGCITIEIEAGKQITVGISAGYTFAKTGDDISSLLDRADQAMYLDKADRKCQNA